MPALVKFQPFVEALAEKQHNLQSDTLKVMFSNTAPALTAAVKADLAEIAAGNGYAAGGPQVAVSSSAQAAGTYKLVVADAVVTAAGGAIGPFRYVILYNATSLGLIGYADYGSAISLDAGSSLTIDFDDAGGVLTLA